MHDIEDEKDTPPNDKPGRSTGPRTSAGKAKSSMNRLTHGLRSEKTILRDEDPADFESTVQAWLDIYDPQDRKEDELVNETVHAHWHLKRAKKRLEAQRARMRAARQQRNSLTFGRGAPYRDRFARLPQ